MHEMELGKSNALPDQSAAPGAQRKMVAFNALCIPFPGYDRTLRDVFLICVIVIRIDAINMKRCQQGSQLVQVFMLSRTKAIGQRNASTMIHCPPQPILLWFVMDKGPHLIHFRPIQINLFRRYYVNLFYLMFLDIFLIYPPSPAFRFFKWQKQNLLQYPIFVQLRVFLCNQWPIWGPALLPSDPKLCWYILPQNFGGGTPGCCIDISVFLPCCVRSDSLVHSRNADILWLLFLLPFPFPAFLFSCPCAPRHSSLILPRFSACFNLSVILPFFGGVTI